MSSHHATVNGPTRPINRVNQHKTFRGCPPPRHQFNSRPGLFNNLIFLPPSIHNCLVNPLFVVNLNCHNLASVLGELSNLSTLPTHRQQRHNKHKARNEPLLTLTPFLCFYLSPLQAGVNRTSMDYYRYLWTHWPASLFTPFFEAIQTLLLMCRLAN